MTDELLQDVGYLGDYVQRYAFDTLGSTLDTMILSGGPAYTGVIGDTNTTTVNVSTVPTVNQLFELQQAVLPGLNPEWYIGPAMWTAIKGAMCTAANLNSQLIDITGMKLVGRPVNAIPQLNGIIYGDFSKYTVVNARFNNRYAISEHVNFSTDETVARLVTRSAGAPSFNKRTLLDGTVAGAFAKNA